MRDEVYEDVTYKGEPGTLTLYDNTFHYKANYGKTSVKCSWARVDKRQLSPETSNQHMIKLLLVSGKTAVFQVKDRRTLEQLRKDAQTRMEVAKKSTEVEDPSMRQSQRESEDRMDSTSTRRSSTTTRVWQDEPPEKSSRRDNNNACEWCCYGTLVCWICFCIALILILVAAFLIYWFVFRDQQQEEDILVAVGIKDPDIRDSSLPPSLVAVGIKDPDIRDSSLPPDHGLEERYGIRSADFVWDQESVTLQYRVSDYILNDSMNYIVYDGLECREGSNDITKGQTYLFVELSVPNDGGANLQNEGQGTRNVDIHFTLNKADITKAPFTTTSGLDKAQLNFCMGLSINYNRGKDWNQVQEVNAVETAIQLDIDLSDFRRIDKVVVKPIVTSKYRRLLRGRQ